MAGGQVYVGMKLRITTYGSHNGMIIHSGIQHSKQSIPAIWPYSNYAQPVIPTVQLPVTPLPIQDTLPLPSSQNNQKIITPPSASPVYSFDLPDSPPDEFIEPNKNPDEVPNRGFDNFEPDQTSYYEKPISVGRKDIPQSTPGDYIPEKYGSSHSLNYLYPGSAEIGRKEEDSYPNNYQYSNDQQFPPKYTDVPSCSQPYIYEAPVHHSHQPVYDEKNLSGSEYRSQNYSYYNGDNKCASKSVNYEGLPNQKFDPQSWGANELPENLQHPEKGRLRSSRKHYGSLPNRRSLDANGGWTQTSKGSRELPKDATSEAIFHLYQTRDAFGNIRYQW